MSNSKIYHTLISCSIEGIIAVLLNEQSDLAEERIFEFLSEHRYTKLSFDGKEVMKFFNIKPGKMIKDIKDRLFDALLDGEVSNSKEDQLEFIKREFNFK